MAMNAEMKAKWLEALRSGKYWQARGDMKTGSGFCCLGVLCEVINDGKMRLLNYNCDHVGQYPSALDAGLSPNDCQALWVRNDGAQGKRPHTFAQIADYIEENL